MNFTPKNKILLKILEFHIIVYKYFYYSIDDAKTCQAPGLMEELHYFLIYLIENLTLVCRRILSILWFGHSLPEYYNIYIYIINRLLDNNKDKDIQTVNSICSLPSVAINEMKTNIQSMINNNIYTTSSTPNTINNTPITSITKGIYGFPIKQYEVETDDGYYITLLRIPRQNTRKCVYKYIIYNLYFLLDYLLLVF